MNMTSADDIRSAW